MDKKELAYAKHGALAAKKWDTFQVLIKKCLRLDFLAGKKCVCRSSA